MNIHSYPTIYSLGHKALTELWDQPVVIQEKVDGSQISWAILDGVLKIRSKGTSIDPDAPDGMFERGVREIIARIDVLHHGWTYRGEYLQKPKHNSLAYDRTPKDFIVLFDVDKGLEDYLLPSALVSEAQTIGLESVPLLSHAEGGDLTSLIPEWLERESFLGGQKLEGVVIKAYGRFGTDKKTLMGKYVSEAFKEVHKKAWGAANPGPNSVVEQLVRQYRTTARWNKAVMHLAERGELIEDSRDIGALMKEVQLDTIKECADDIKEELFKFFWKDVSRGLTRGLAEWYKQKLAGITGEVKDDD